VALFRETYRYEAGPVRGTPEPVMYDQEDPHKPTFLI